MNVKKTIHSLIGGAILASAMLSVPAQAQTLRLSNWVPPTHHIVTDVLDPWIQQVEEVTEGRVKITLLPKPMGSPAQHWELARKGIADIAWGNFTYEPERFKALWFAEMPLNGTNAEASSVALWDTVQAYLADNEAFKGVKLLGVGTLGASQIHHGSRDIVGGDAFENQKVRMGGPIQKSLLEEMGAIPIAAPATKAYELLESGVIDGSLHPWESVLGFRLEDVLSHHTTVPGGFSDATFFIVMNERAWNRLSPADQDAVMSVSGEHLSRLWGRDFDEKNAAAEAALRAAGHSFSEPSAEFMTRLEAARGRMLEEWAADGAAFEEEAPMELVEFYRQRIEALEAQ